MPASGISAMKASSDPAVKYTMRGTGGCVSAEGGTKASSTASPAITPRTRRGNASAPKPPERPAGSFSKPKVSANSAAATAMTAAAAMRLADTLLQQAERFEGFLPFDHELIELRLPG